MPPRTSPLSALTSLPKCHLQITTKPIFIEATSQPTPSNPAKHLSTTFSHHKKPILPPRPTLPDSEIKHVYLKGSGPGGQKINKTSSAVQLTHLPTGIVVKSQATRSQSQNHTIARRILAEKVEVAEKGDLARVSLVEALRGRRKRSGEKKRRRKYRKLVGEGGVEVGKGVVGGVAAGKGVDGFGKEGEGEGEDDEDEDEYDEDGGEHESEDDKEDIGQEGGEDDGLTGSRTDEASRPHR